MEESKGTHPRNVTRVTRKDGTRGERFKAFNSLVHQHGFHMVKK